MPELRTAIQEEPGFYDAYYTLGTVFMELGELDEALDVYTGLENKLPNDPEVIQQLGCVLQRAGRHEEAVTQFKRGLALDPEAWEMRLHLAVAYTAMKEYGKALVEVQSVLKQDGQTDAVSQMRLPGNRHYWQEGYSRARQEWVVGTDR